MKKDISISIAAGEALMLLGTPHTTMRFKTVDISLHSRYAIYCLLPTFLCELSCLSFSVYFSSILNVF
jgi:hypothetical protein